MVPEPRAIRLRREPSRRVTSLRSVGVMEQTMASTREISPSSIWPAAWRISLDMPGMSFISPPSEPIFLTWRSWDRKSSSVKWPCMRRAAPLATVSWSMVRSACSMRLSTSPMPRMRSAMRSGWNRSKSASRSPVLAKAIGLPTTPLTERAAPPRASPSSLERITRVERERLVEGLGGRHGVLADHGVDDQERVVRLGGGRDPPDLVHQVGVDRQPTGGVDDADVLARDAGPPRPRPGPRPPDRWAR